MDMLPTVYKQQLIEQKRDEHLEKKKSLLVVENVQWNLSKNEMSLAESSVQIPIRKIQDNDLVEKLKNQVKFICRDIGISYWDDKVQMKYDGARFFTTIKKYYDDLSLSEIKMAFEMASIGELDEWLPKDKHGNPDSKHYNSFNLAYYTKILNAYRSKRNKVWSKVRKFIPKKEVLITDEEKKKNNEFFINEIYGAFDNYMINKIKPNFKMSIYLQTFVDQKIIKNVPEPTKETIDLVYRKSLKKTSGKERRMLIDEYHSNNFSGILSSDYQTAQNNIEMQRVFDEIIKQNKHLKDYLKYRYKNDKT